jgi:hypothetical protein
MLLLLNHESLALEWDRLFVAEADGVFFVSHIDPGASTTRQTKDASSLLSILSLGKRKPRMEACIIIIIITCPPTAARATQPFILVPLVYTRVCGASTLHLLKMNKRRLHLLTFTTVAFCNSTHDTALQGMESCNSGVFAVPHIDL